MSKELINIISKDDLKTLVNQVYEQKKIYRKSESVKNDFTMLPNDDRYFFKNTIDLKDIEVFSKYTLSEHFNSIVDNFDLILDMSIHFSNREIYMSLYCRSLRYQFLFDELGIRRTPKSTVEETTNAIIELIEEINNKQNLFKLVWSE